MPRLRMKGRPSEEERRRSMLGVLYAVCREFFFYGTATQVRRKRCCGCLGRRNLLQRHVTSSLEGKRERGENVTYTETRLCCFLRVNSTTRDSVFQVRLRSSSDYNPLYNPAQILDRRKQNCVEGIKIKKCRYISDIFIYFIARFFALGGYGSESES